MKKPYRKLNKKGVVGQIAIFIVAIFAIVLTVVIVKYVLNQFYTALADDDLNTPEMLEAQAAVESNYAWFDYSIVLVFVIFVIGLIITSFMIPTHPIFMVINIIGIFILVFIGMVLNNVYTETVAGDSPELETTSDEFSMSVFLIQYLPYISAIVLFIVSVVQYTRSGMT